MATVYDLPIYEAIDCYPGRKSHCVAVPLCIAADCTHTAVGQRLRPKQLDEPLPEV